MAEPLDPSTALDPAEVANRRFNTTRRGFNQEEVRAFLVAMANAWSAERRRTAWLEQRLAEAEARAVPPELDEQELTRLLGDQTAKVLDAAHAAAAEIRTRAEENVARVVREATEEAAALRASAQEETTQLRTETAEQTEAMRTEAETALGRARQEAASEAEVILAGAREEGRQLVAEARTVRERVLRDLATRRKTARQHLEQLRVARARLIETYEEVRRLADEATGVLDAALPQARAAAESAARRATAIPDPTLEDLEAELTLELTGGPPHPATEDGEAEAQVKIEAEAETEPEPAAEPEPEADAEAEAEPEPETEPEAQAEPEPVIDLVEPVEPAPGDESNGEVDAIFARIRAAHEENGDEGGPDAAADDGVVAAPPAEAADLASALATRLEQRDAATEEIERRLARRLRRVLADEQSAVLDAVRRSRPALPSLEVVAGVVEEHAGQAVDAAVLDLHAAVEAGARFEDAPPSPETTVRDLAESLVGEVNGVVRSSVERAFELIAEDDDGTQVTSRIRACYREWRTPQLQATVSPFVLQAFGRGAFDVLPADATLRWVVDPSSPSCPDAEQNSAAGPTGKGTPFPSGHVHPPAYPTCRCLLVAEPTP